MTKIITQVYPNGEFRTVFCEDNRAGNAVDDDSPAGVGSSGGGTASDSPLDITSKVRTASPDRSGFGSISMPTRFGNNARRTLSRAAGVFDADKIPPHESVFLTGTIPGGTKAAFDAMALWSSYAVDLTKSHLSKLGVRSAYCMYVWEFQRRGALHLHYMVHVRDDVTRQKVLDNWKKVWCNVIDAVGKKACVDMWERARGGTWASDKSVLQADAQEVKKSVGSYLAKYLGKQAPVLPGMAEGGEYFMGPVRWYGVSRPLLARMKQLTRVVKVECVSLYRVRKVKEELMELLTYSENPVYTYWSKDKHSQVFVTYDQTNATQIFDTFVSRIAPPRRICDDRIVDCTECNASNAERSIDDNAEGSKRFIQLGIHLPGMGGYRG